MTLHPVFYHRDFTPMPAQPAGPYRVLRCAWSALGGPESALLAAPPGALRRGLPLHLLRCPVELYDEAGQPAWWGYVQSIEVRQPATTLRYSLEEMFNRVRVDFRYVSGSEPTHYFLDDLPSQGVFGQKERFIDLGVIDNRAQAEARAAAHLSRERVPHPGLSGRDQPSGELRLELRGWWETLGWRMHCWNGDGLRQYTPPPVDEVNVGASSSAARACQPFDGPALGLPWYASRLRLSLRKTGAPTDTLRIGIYQDGDSGPTGPELDGLDVSAAGLTTTLAWYEFELEGLRARLEPGRRYGLVFQRSGALNSANAYRIGVDAPPATGGMYAMKVWNGSAWVLRSPLAVAVHALWGQCSADALIGFHAGAERGGQFLNGALCETAGDRRAPFYRGRPLSHRREIVDLLALDAERRLTQVTPGRGLRVFAAPPPVPAGARLDAHGALLESSTGRPFPLHRPPVGLWAESEHAPAPFFIERVVWEGGGFRVQGA